MLDTRLHDFMLLQFNWCLFHTTFVFKFYIYKTQVYMILCYYVPFVGFISIFLFWVFFNSNPAFDDATDCAWVVAFQSFLVAHPFFDCHNNCVNSCVIFVQFLKNEKLFTWSWNKVLTKLCLHICGFSWTIWQIQNNKLKT